MKKFFPPPDVFVEMEPEDAATYLLIYLNDFVKNNNRKELHKSHFINSSTPDIRDYSGAHLNQVMRVMAEAWSWLEREGYLAPFPDAIGSEGWVIISRRGEKIQSPNDFKKFEHIKLLPKNVLDPILATKVWPSFIAGDFDTAVFAAYKEVEIRTRKAASLNDSWITEKLARKAFDKDNGPLTDKDSPEGEKVAYGNLFAGVIGVFKNPSSHRDINYDDPIVAVGAILFANTLLQIIDKRAAKSQDKDIEQEKFEASS